MLIKELDLERMRSQQELLKENLNLKATVMAMVQDLGLDEAKYTQLLNMKEPSAEPNAEPTPDAPIKSKDRGFGNE